MSTPDLVIISCGASKQPRPSAARDLYTGPFFRCCRRAAEALSPWRGWLILSAKYGLIRPAAVIEPYDLRMGQPGSVTAATVAAQATAMGLSDCGNVVVFAGQRYAAIVRAIWPEADVPAQRLRWGGMGRQMSYMTLVARTGMLG